MFAPLIREIGHVRILAQAEEGVRKQTVDAASFGSGTVTGRVARVTSGFNEKHLLVSDIPLSRRFRAVLLRGVSSGRKRQDC